MREVGALMKAKLLREAGEITEGTEVEIGDERLALRRGRGRAELYRRAGL